MGAAGEEVDGLGVREGVALLREAADIARESGRVAGDIDNALRGHADHGLDDIGGKALARRIDDDDVRVGVFARVVFGVLFVVGRKNLFRFSNEKFSVFDLVDFRIVLRIRDCLRDDFDAVDFFGFLREEQGNRSDAAV